MVACRIGIIEVRGCRYEDGARDHTDGVDDHFEHRRALVGDCLTRNGFGYTAILH